MSSDIKVTVSLDAAKTERDINRAIEKLKLENLKLTLKFDNAQALKSIKNIESAISALSTAAEKVNLTALTKQMANVDKYVTASMKNIGGGFKATFENFGKYAAYAGKEYAPLLQAA